MCFNYHPVKFLLAPLMTGVGIAEITTTAGTAISIGNYTHKVKVLGKIKPPQMGGGSSGVASSLLKFNKLY